MILDQSDVNIGVYESDRRKVASLLSVLLADSYLLMLKTQNFHWNVTGPMFGSLHLLFEKQYHEIYLAIDEIAEAIRGLGFLVPSSFGEFMKRTSIQESNGPIRATEMLLELIVAHEVVIESSRVVLDAAESAGDLATSDLVTNRIKVHEKAAWQLRSSLEN